LAELYQNYFNQTSRKIQSIVLESHPYEISSRVLFSISFSWPNIDLTCAPNPALSQPDLIKGFLSFSTRGPRAITNMIGAFLLRWPEAARRRWRRRGLVFLAARQPPAKFCASESVADVFFPLPLSLVHKRKTQRTQRASERRTLLICECSRRAQ